MPGRGELVLVEVVGEDLQELLVVISAELKYAQVGQEFVLFIFRVKVFVFLPLQGLLSIEMLFNFFHIN